MEWREFDDPKKEREKLIRAIRKKPCAQLYYELATVYENFKAFDKAIYYGKKAVRLEPQNSDFIESLDFVYGRTSNIPAAIKYFENRLRTNDDWHGQIAIALKNARECLPDWEERNLYKAD